MLEYYRIREDMKKTKDELNIIKDDANKKVEIEKELCFKVAELLKAKNDLEEKNNVIKDLKKILMIQKK